MLKRERLWLEAGEIRDNIYESVDLIFRKIEKLNAQKNNEQSIPVSFSFFLKSSQEIFSNVRKYIIEKLQTLYTQVPTYSIIGQSAASGANVAVEVNMLAVSDHAVEIDYLLVNTGNYITKIETNQFIEYHIFGITVNNNSSVLQQVNDAFALLENTLNNLGLGFDSIIRQWNYIENIVGFSDIEGANMQNYQILNNVRHEFYSKYKFSKGFPAATGIGMSMGGFVLDCVAVREKTDLEISPVKNPVQVSAYDYSENVLIGSKTEKSIPKLSPKFERAKLYLSGSDYTLLVSGTAAIHNEISVAIDNASNQTEITLDNIDKLIRVASEIIEKRDKRIEKVTYPYLRVYIKNPADYQSVKNICEKHTPPINPVYLISDICRSELLVEIEGIISIAVK